MAIGLVELEAKTQVGRSAINVDKEKSRTDLVLPNDKCLIPAVSATIHHVASHTGMSAEAEAALLHKAEDVCSHALPPADSNGAHVPPSFGTGQGHAAGENGHVPSMQVSVLEFPDRVEVVMEHPKESGAGKLPAEMPKRRSKGMFSTAMGFVPEAEPPAESTNGVDRIVRQSLGDRIRITLVQYCHGPCKHS